MSSCLPTRRIAAFTLLALGLATAFAGPLNPPAGPVAPTPGPEPRIAINATNTPGDTDSLFKITQPGSYYLTGNITGVANKHGIEIATPGVTIDLSGFQLVGVPGSLTGIIANAELPTSNLAVMNGHVRNWGIIGVDVSANSFATGSRVHAVHAHANTNIGIVVGPRSIVSECTSVENGASGFGSGSGSVFIGCTASGNLSNGFTANTGGTFQTCTAFGNTSNGFSVSNDANLIGCTASQNTGHGINIANGGSISNCVASQNDLNGFFVGSGCTVTGCSALNNDQHGFSFSQGSNVTNCTARSNGSAIADGAGFRCFTDSRLQGNVSSGNDRGVDCTGAGNILFGNTCTGNSTNWVLAANNVFGPIIDRTAPGSAAVSGNAAADSSGSTHPHANFSY